MIFLHQIYMSFKKTNSLIDELHQSSEFTGGHSRVEIPVPFPNTEVKRSNVDGTAACPWESRKLPVFFMPLFLIIQNLTFYLSI